MSVPLQNRVSLVVSLCVATSTVGTIDIHPLVALQASLPILTVVLVVATGATNRHDSVDGLFSANDALKRDFEERHCENEYLRVLKLLGKYLRCLKVFGCLNSQETAANRSII